MKNSDSKNSAHLKYVKLLCLLGSPFILQYFILSYDALFLVLLLGVIAFVYLDSSPCPTYLLDFACYCLPNHLKISNHEFIELAKKSGNFRDESIEFQQRVLENSGIGDQSYMPRLAFQADYNASLEDCREEAAAAMFGPIDNVLAATGVTPAEIGILVVNCGGLNTTPSMVVNHYKLGAAVQSFNLGAMGCLVGVAAVEAARDLLAVHPWVTYALVVSAEVMASAWHSGDDCDKHVSNCLLRPGAAAALLSGARRSWPQAKYELAGLRRSISPLVVETEFKHACVAAVEEVSRAQAKLGLSDGQMEASRTLERFGNTSSSSVWYALAYLEYVDKVKAGDRVWQVAFGSGIKCNNKAASHSPWC